MPQSFVRPGEGANRPRPEPSTTADGPAIRSILYLAPVAALLVGLGAALADSTPSIGEILTTVIVPTIVGVFVLIGRTRPAFLRAAAYGLFVEAILAGCFATVGLAFAVVLPMVGVALVQPQLRGRQMIGALVAAGVAAIAGVTAAAVVGPARTLFAEMPVIVPIAGFATIVTFGLALQWRANRQLFGALALAEGEIAARDRAEAELDRTSEILSAIVRSSPVATQAFDLDRNVTIWNPASERIFGWSADEVVGRPMPLAMTPPEERMPSQARIARTIQGGVATGDRVRRLTKDGEERWIDIYAAPLRDRRGTTIGIAGQLVDVTERVQLEAQLLHAQKMEAIGLLASGLAHDFNNTLTVAGGFAELIKAETADADVATDAAAIIEVVEKARELTQRLLAVARDTSRPSEPVDVCGVVVELAPLLRQLLGGTIEVELELPDRPMVACLDTCQLEQALINLAVNARDAMPDGGTITIGVRATDATNGAAGGAAAAASPGALVEIFVRDTGIGIAPDILEQVFEPFFTTKATGKGSGLGLAMVSGFAARTGGEVTVASELGVGTTFAIRLPEVLMPSVAPARVRAEGSKPRTGRRAKAPTPSAAGLHARAS
jgi:PAS domain S-box-containing protein